MRVARAEDADGMREITRTVWDGDDYVPFVWDRWLRGHNGSLLVATQDGQVVGLQHVEVQPDGGAWLEGIRVAEAVRGQGVGEALVERGVSWAREMGCPAARLAVSSENAASNRLSEKTGFRVTGRFRGMKAGAETFGVESIAVRLAQPFDDEAIIDLLEIAGYTYPATYTEGWTAYRLTRKRLRLLLAMHAVLVAGGVSPEAVAIATASNDRPSLRLGLVAGSPAGIRAIGLWLRDAAQSARIPTVRGTLAAGPESLAALTEAGFLPGNEDMLLRERGLS